ncbi:MAG: ROK family protein [Pseudomonadota bacterium]
MEPNRFSPLLRQALSRLAQRGALPRAVLADELGASPQTIMRLAGAMRDAGLVTERRQSATGRGQPGLELDYRHGALATVGLSIAQHQIAIALRDVNGACLYACNLDRTFGSVTASQEAVETLLDEARAACPAGCRIVGLGAALQGYFIEASRRVVARSDPQGWAGLDIRQWLRGVMDVPAVIANDGRILAGSLIADASTRNFFAVWLGVGVGGGLVLDGELREGAHGNAGEIAALLPHIAARPTEPNFRAAAGFKDWSQWPGLANLAPNARASLEHWGELAAQEMSRALNAILAIADIDHVYLTSQMPTDLIEWFCAKIRWRPLGERFVSLRRDASLQLPGPKIIVRAPRPMATLAAGLAAQQFFADSFEEGEANV